MSAINTFAETQQSLIRLTEKFEAAEINIIPVAGSWSAGQLADHVLKSQQGFPALLKGTSETATRQPEEKRDGIKKIFLDFSNKMKSPDFIVPDDGPFEKDSLLARMHQTAEAFADAMSNADLSRVLLDFELPNSGKFTGTEWAWFMIYHTQRHQYQLENIYRIVKKIY